MRTITPKAPLPILIVPRETPAATVRELKAGGYLVIITDEPDKVKLVLPSSIRGNNHMLMSALHGLTKGSDSQSMNLFTRELHRRLLEQDTQQQAATVEKKGEQ